MPRADVFQLGVLALSMLLARRVTPADLEHRLGFLLDQWSKAASPRGRLFGDPLRLWLERALQVGERHYESAAEAYADLRRLPSASGAREFEFLHAERCQWAGDTARGTSADREGKSGGRNGTSLFVGRESRSNTRHR